MLTLAEYKAIMGLLTMEDLMTIIKAIKRPNPISVVQVNSNDDIKTIPNCKDGENYEVYCRLHNTWIKFKLGDYINVTNPDDMYPIDKDVFESSYDVIAPAPLNPDQ